MERSKASTKYRIRTLTLVYPRGDNYGAYLQGWALCQALNRIPGIDAKCLRYYEFDFDTARKELSWGTRLRNRVITRGLQTFKDCALGAAKEAVWSFIESVRGEESPEKRRRLTRFAEFGKSFQDFDSPICWNYLELAKAKTDAFLVGSDWVWYVDLKCPKKGYFGDVRTDKPFYSYAASFGINPDTPEKRSFVAGIAKNFCNLSVREREGTETLRQLGFESAHNDVDPTLLLSPEEWERAVVVPQKTYNLVVYWLPNTDAGAFADYVSDYRARHPKMSVVVVNPNPLTVSGADYRWDIGPQDFLGYIKSADYVITNSFHACVFCAMFDTSFTVVPRYKGDTRIQNFLQLSGLEARLMENMKNIDEDTVIDWKTVHNKISIRGGAVTEVPQRGIRRRGRYGQIRSRIARQGIRHQALQRMAFFHCRKEVMV